MLATILMLVHVTSLAAYTVYIRKVAVGGVNKYQFSAVSQTAFVTATLIILLSGIVDFEFRLEPFQYVTVVISAILIAIFNVMRVVALKHVEASYYQILFNLRLFLLTILAAVFFDEIPPLMQIIGGLVIFASILTVSIKDGKFHLQKGMEWGIYIAVFFSLHALLEKYNIEEVGLGSYMLWVGPLITVFNWAMVYFTKTEMAPYSTFLKPDMLAAVLLPVVSGWTYVAAISVAQIAVVNYVSGLSVVAAVAAGVVILKEKDHLRQKIIATVLAVIGLTLILLGNINT